MSKDLFVNGDSVYRWRPRGYVKGKKPKYLTWATERFHKLLNSGVKDQAPILEGCSSETYKHIVFADFDPPDKSKPDSPPSGFSTWDSLENYLRTEYPNGSVFHTFSNLPKLMFLVELPGINEVDEKSIYEALGMILRENIFKIIDGKFAAMTTTVLTPENTKDISESLPRLKPIKLFLESELLKTCPARKFVVPSLRQYLDHPGKNNEQVSLSYKLLLVAIDTYQLVNTQYKYKRYEAELSPWTKRLAKSRTPAKEDFLRILLASPKLLEDGFDLPIIHLSKLLNVSAMSISRWIRELESKNLLVCIRFATPGVHTKRYLASGLLKQDIETISPGGMRRTPLPANPEDGEWDVGMFKGSQHFGSDREGFTEWAECLPGIHDKPDRIKRIQHLNDKWDQYLKNRGKVS